MNNSRLDRVSITDAVSKARVDENGILRGICPVTRCGVFLYHNDDGSERYELRPREEVFSQESLESIKMIPITMHHPAEGYVDASVATRESIGTTGETVKTESELVFSSLVVYDKAAVEAIRSGKTCELSLGYTADVDAVSGTYEGQHFDCVQRNIRYNHLSVVDQARAGHNIRIITDGVYMGTKADAGVPGLTRDPQLKAPMEPLTLNDQFQRLRSDTQEKIDAMDKKIDSIIGRLDESEAQRKLVGKAAKEERKKLRKAKKKEDEDGDEDEDYEDGEEEERKAEVKARTSNKGDSVDEFVRHESMRRAKFLTEAISVLDSKAYLRVAAGRTDSIRDEVLAKKELLTRAEIEAADGAYLDAFFDLSLSQKRLDRAEPKLGDKSKKPEEFVFADDARKNPQKFAEEV